MCLKIFTVSAATTYEDSMFKVVTFRFGKDLLLLAISFWFGTHASYLNLPPPLWLFLMPISISTTSILFIILYICIRCPLFRLSSNLVNPRASYLFSYSIHLSSITILVTLLWIPSNFLILCLDKTFYTGVANSRYDLINVGYRILNNLTTLGVTHDAM